jgi:hypothetical protein
MMLAPAPSALVPENVLLKKQHDDQQAEQREPAGELDDASEGEVAAVQQVEVDQGHGSAPLERPEGDQQHHAGGERDGGREARGRFAAEAQEPEHDQGHRGGEHGGAAHVEHAARGGIA